MAAVARGGGGARAAQNKVREVREHYADARALYDWAWTVVDDLSREGGLHAFGAWIAASADAPVCVPYVKSVVSRRADDVFGQALVVPHEQAAVMLADTVCIMAVLGDQLAHRHVFGAVWRASLAELPRSWLHLFDSFRSGTALMTHLASVVQHRSPGTSYARRDVHRFFHGVTPDVVERALQTRKPAQLADGVGALYDACAARVVAQLRSLQTVARGLPIGVFSSHLLAELVLYDVDDVLAPLCARLGVTLLRMADDFHFLGPAEAVRTAVAEASVQIEKRAWAWNATKREDLTIGADDVLRVIHIPAFLQRDVPWWSERRVDGDSLASQCARLQQAVVLSVYPYYGQDGYAVPSIRRDALSVPAMEFVRMFATGRKCVATLRYIADVDATAAEILVPCAAQCLLALDARARHEAMGDLRELATHIVRDEDDTRCWLRALRHVVMVLSLREVLDVAREALRAPAVRRPFVCAVLWNELSRRAHPASRCALGELGDRVSEVLERLRRYATCAVRPAGGVAREHPPPSQESRHLGAVCITHSRPPDRQLRRRASRSTRTSESLK